MCSSFVSGIALSPTADLCRSKARAPVTVAGRKTELHTTSVFEGRTREVQVLWLKGTGYEVEYIVWLRFERCPDDAVEEVLRKVEMHW